MCEELNTELDHGTELVQELVRHMISMGGPSVMKQFVEVDGRGYDVTFSVEGQYPGVKGEPHA